MRRVDPAGSSAAQPAVDPAEAAPGDLHDLVAFYNEHQRRLYALCLSTLGNPADAEDVVQDAFIRVAPLLPRLNGDKGTFLRVVARNLCRDELRRRRFRADVEVPEGLCASIEERAVDTAELRQVWGTLKEADRSLLAHAFAGYSHSEIAERTGKSAKSINVGIVRARKRARLVAGAASVLGAPAAVWRVLRGFGRRAAQSASNVQASAMFGDLQHVGALITPAAATMVAAVVVGGSPAPAAAQRPAPARAPVAAAFTDVITPADAIDVSVTVPVDVTPATPIGQVVIHPPVAARPPASSAPTASAPTTSAAPPSSPTTPVPVSTPPPLSSYGSPPPPQQVEHGVVSPGSNAPQQDAAFNSLTPSPSYQQDGTVYGSGTLLRDCYRPSCPVLYRTTDGGANWTSLPATGFAGGTILLPPSYSAANPTLFAIGQVGLQRSDDGGTTFVPVTPTPVPATMMPGSPQADPQVLLATSPLSIYHTANGQTTLGPVLPLKLVSVDDVAATSDGTVFVTGEQADGASGYVEDGVVVRCPAQSACVVVQSDPTMQGMRLAVSPTFAVDHTVIAYAAQHAIVSYDGGATFTPLNSATSGAIEAVAYSATFALDGHVLIALQLAPSPTQTATELESSTDGARTFSALTPQGLDARVKLNALQALPDGRILAALNTGDPIGTYGIRCSSDGGATWSVSC